MTLKSKPTLITIGLILTGILITVLLLTVNRISRLGTRSVAPTAPESKPAAFESNQCQVGFTVTTLTCNQSCTQDEQCGTNLVCDTDSNTCRNPGCDTQSSCQCPTPPQIDLSLNKEVSNNSPQIGETITFTITTTNAGPDTATGVTVADPIPAGLTYQTSTPTKGTYSPQTNIWDIGTIEPNSAVDLVITATVDTLGRKINTAQVETADQPDPDSTPGNDVPEEDDQDTVTTNPTSNTTPNPTPSHTPAPTPSTTPSPTPSTNSAQPQTPEQLPVSGSLETTIFTSLIGIGILSLGLILAL